MDIPKMNLFYIIVVILQICVNVNTQLDWNRSWGSSSAPSTGPSSNPSWRSPQRSTGSSTSDPPQRSTGGSSRPSQGRCNCDLYQTCAWVRHGNAPPQMDCINAIGTRFSMTGRNSNAGGRDRRTSNHNPIDSNPGREPSGVPSERGGSVPDTDPVSNTGIQGRVSNIQGDADGIYYLFYRPGFSTGLRVNITKTGYCSRVPATRSSRVCKSSCLSDKDCSGDRKCCPNGCSIGCAPIQAQPRESGSDSGDLPARPTRRLSHGRRLVPSRRETFPRQRDVRTRTEFDMDSPKMRPVNNNDLIRTRLPLARGSNGQQPRTFEGHRSTERFVQQPDVKFMSRRQGNVRNTPRSGHNSGVQPGSDLATQRYILNTGTQSSSRNRQSGSAVNILGRQFIESINRFNRHSSPPARQKHKSSRQVQRRRKSMQPR